MSEGVLAKLISEHNLFMTNSQKPSLVRLKNQIVQSNLTLLPDESGPGGQAKFSHVLDQVGLCHSLRDSNLTQHWLQKKRI